MLTADPTDVVLDLLKHEEQLQNVLEDPRIRDDFVELLLEILAKVYETHMKENLIKIMALFPNTVFIRSSLPRYVMQLPMKGRRTPQKHVKNIILFFDQLLRRFPDNYSEIPLDSLVVATMSLGSEMQSQVSTQVQNLVSMRQRIIEKKSKPRSKMKEPQPEPKPPDDFREISVYPTTDDLQENKVVFLRKNIVEGKYEDVTHYLDVQFRLLREDFVGPLRDGVNEIAGGVTRDERNQNLRIYRNIEIIDTVCTNSGIVYSIGFDIRPLRRVNWENSKRLIFGTFLCLSKDNFKTLVFATVTERKPEQLLNGELQVRFLGELPDIHRGDHFQMVESPGYYESYCHNLQGLQELSDDKMPFARYLVYCETDVHPPKYLSKDKHDDEDDDDMVDNPHLPLSARYDFEDILSSKQWLPPVNILSPSAWPKVDDVELNQSQLDAIQAALTKEFVVIQGPPGTGKTYVGLKIVQVLLNNQKHWRLSGIEPRNIDRREMGFYERFASETVGSPMLVVCYTNHALDQFLEGILDFDEEGIVRVGGRSDSERLKEYNLWNKARRTVAWYNIQDRLKDLSNQIQEEKNCLKKANFFNLKLEDLFPVIGESEMNQLLPYVNVAAFINTTVLQAWLNMQPLPFYAHVSLEKDEMNRLEQEGDRWDVEGDTVEEDDDDDDVRSDSDDSEELGENDVDQAGYEGVREDEGDKEEATVDVEKDAERLQNERKLGDDFAAIQRDEEDAGQGMTQDHFNFVNLRRRIAELEEEQRNQENFAPPDISLWRLDFNTRRQLYQHWVRRYQETHLRELEELYQEYEVSCHQMTEIKHGQEEDALRRATVIGMTTTGAAKYRNVLQKIRPKIIVVEEAAEVLEAHIVTALSQGAEHLILIGDHKQLKPNPSVYTLAKKYNLEVSLFERMVRNGMKCHTLDTQHRMRPEIARLMKFIYDDLKNHVSVENFEDILGISKNIFFIDHQKPEKSDDELRSHSNEHEAKYIVALCGYLLRQGYDRTRITVLTTYTGQLLQLKRLMPKAQFQGVRLCTVDNFQGEENDIILLSLVRSNEESKIGFLGISNRVCVALSRARMGFFCIGNISMMAGKNELWQKIKNELEQQQAIGSALPTYCQNHKDTKVEMVTAQDFKKAPEGGCTLPCDFRLDCGHKCEMACHPVDRDHKQYVCIKPCNKEVCTFKHRCTRECHHGETCGPCRYLVTKILPFCNHEVAMRCSDDVRTFECTRPCERYLECGHPCHSLCGQDCNVKKCEEKVMKTLQCGHKVKISCSTPIETYKCEEPCESHLDCEHKCAGNCHKCKQGRIHLPCQYPCGRTLICSHSCKEPCTRDCPPCQQDCQNQCLHSKCRKTCGEACAPCQEPCSWECKHKKCKKLCSEICERKPCNVHCKKKLPLCGHKCVGLCGEKCPRLCRVCNKEELTEIFFGDEDNYRARFVELLDCGHVFEVENLDKWMAREEDDVTNIQLKSCPKCKTPIRKSFRYGNVIKKVLRDIEEIKKKVRENGEDSKKKITELNSKLSDLRSKYPLVTKSSDDTAEENLGLRRRKVNLRVAAQLPQKNSPYSTIVSKMDSASNQELDLLMFQVQLLPSIYEIKTKFLERMEGNSKFDDLRQKLTNLETFLMAITKFSSQLMSDLYEEVQRIGLACKLRMVQHDIAASGKSVPREIQSNIDEISALFQFKSKIKNEVREKAIKDLDKICKDLGLGAITAEERAAIVRAVGLTKGHWFKCPNGHFYAIGECGGATERGVCPECHEVIGGEHHTLEASNQFAPEMDGALHPAWSNQANLANYDLEELRFF
ncbi:NFX1-type zinc finger-containing protein 1-like isoform X2 [Dendronephthya gigantea]|nr:NFX1-type zinc finger-containing protein 1-like isoform X2 [Dendronephthya gigantea]